MQNSKLPEDPKEQSELLAVALLVVENKTTEEICEILKLPENRVRRLRTLANKLQLYTVDLLKASNEDIMEQARILAYRSDLLEKLQTLPGGRRLKLLKVVVSGTDRVKTHEPRLDLFAEAAAPHLHFALLNAETSLVTFGTTIQQTFEKTDFKKLTRLNVYPACCDPYEYTHEPWSSWQLARWVTAQQGRPTMQHPSLAGMLPIINPDQALDARKALSKYVQSNPDYIKIYGHEGLASQANCLITSIGRNEYPWALGDDYFVKSVGVIRGALQPLLAAEIGSVPIPRRNLKPHEQLIFDKINAARLGLTLGHIEAIAVRGMSSPAPGVIILALGANKAAYFLELVKRGLVNMAIVDNELAEALVPLLQEQEMQA